MYWGRNVAYSFRLTLLFIGKRRHFLGQFIKVCPRCIVGLGDSWCVRLHIPPRFLQRSVTHGCVQFNNYASFHRIPMPMMINKISLWYSTLPSSSHFKKYFVPLWTQIFNFFLKINYYFEGYTDCFENWSNYSV